MANILTYILLFVGLYFEIFFLVTYLENHQHIQKENTFDTDRFPVRFPTVSIIVPCWNEEKTLAKTIESIQNLDYPKDKLEIIVVDDGSTDNTLTVARRFENDQVRVFHKSNGGKHTALNYGLEQSVSELVGCLDADSYVDANALKNIVLYFEHDREIMVVTPSIKIFQPKSIIQLIQNVEYSWAIFLRKMLALIGAMYVTPGPFSIFKREVFFTLGGYREAHMTEDMEIAMRMQSKGMIISNCHTAFVYTSGPETLKKLYKQRVRWTYGFIQNAIDYRFMFFKKNHGNLGLFVLPIACLSIVTTVYVAGSTIWTWVTNVIQEIIKIQTIGLHFHFSWPTFDWFSINTGLITIASVVALFGMITILVLSRKMAKDTKRFGMDLIYFFAIYSFIAPLWLGKALFNSIFSITSQWR